MKSFTALVLLTLAAPAFASDLPPHTERVWGGWITCESG